MIPALRRRELVGEGRNNANPSMAAASSESEEEGDEEEEGEGEGSVPGLLVLLLGGVLGCVGLLALLGNESGAGGRTPVYCSGGLTMVSRFERLFSHAQRCVDGDW